MHNIEKRGVEARQERIDFLIKNLESIKLCFFETLIEAFSHQWGLSVEEFRESDFFKQIQMTEEEFLSSISKEYSCWGMFDRGKDKLLLWIGTASEEQIMSLLIHELAHATTGRELSVNEDMLLEENEYYSLSKLAQEVELERAKDEDKAIDYERCYYKALQIYKIIKEKAEI